MDKVKPLEYKYIDMPYRGIKLGSKSYPYLAVAKHYGVDSVS